MQKLFFYVFLISYVFQGCSPLRNHGDSALNEQIRLVKVSRDNNPEKATLKGTVTDENGQKFYGVDISISNEKNKFFARSNENGEFSITTDTEGFYTLKVESYDYEPIETEVKLTPGRKVELAIKMKRVIYELEKPIIYLYPTSTQKVSVKLEYDGELEFTYPSYPKDGWEVTAEPDGTLTTENGKEYYALFWEGKPNKSIVPADGFIVSGSETAAFLEEKLAYLGLNRKEANEFIVYWLPKMEKNAFNLIHFSSTAYEELAPLTIEPAPETIIRIMMITTPLENNVDFPVQDLSSMKKVRKGFTVVEWGGSICSNAFLNRFD